MEVISIIKTILDSVKILKDLSAKKSEDNSAVILEKLLLLENELKVLKQDAEIKEEENFNNIQLNLKKLFNSHGIEDNLISEFINETIDNKFCIPISKTSNLNYIFDRLTDGHIDTLTKLFGINKGWIYSQDELYPYKNYYKDINSLISFIISRARVEKLEGFAFRTSDFNYLDEDYYQPLYILIRTPIHSLFNKTIYRYYSIQTDWKWNYWRTRYQIKSLFNLFETPNSYIDFNGRTVTKDELEIISNRNHCPDNIIRNQRQNTWYPHDYSTEIDNNSMALELEETQDVMNYIDSQGYKRFYENTIANNKYT